MNRTDRPRRRRRIGVWGSIALSTALAIVASCPPATGMISYYHWSPLPLDPSGMCIDEWTASLGPDRQYSLSRWVVSIHWPPSVGRPVLPPNHPLREGWHVFDRAPGLATVLDNHPRTSLFSLGRFAVGRLPDGPSNPNTRLGAIWVHGPIWPVSVAFLVWPAAVATLWLKRWHRRRCGRCPRCGYDLRATPDRCPECGATPQ